MFHVKHLVVHHSTASLSLRSFLPSSCEKSFQNAGTLICQDSGNHLKRMVQPLVAVDGVQCSQRTGFRIRRPIHTSVDACLVHQPRAHDARLQCYVHRTACQAPNAKLCRRLLHGHELRMPCRVLLGFAHVACPRNHARLRQRPPCPLIDRLVHYNSTDRHFAQIGSPLRFL